MITDDPIHLALCKSLSSVGELRPWKKELDLPAQEYRDASVCASKNQYPTAQVAAYYATVRESLDPAINLRYYKCRHCHKWHLTSQLPTTQP